MQVVAYMAHFTAADSSQQPTVLLAQCREFDQIPLKLLEPMETDDQCPTHPVLERLADSIKGKHQTPIRYELRLAYRRFLKRGFFRINQKLFDYIHSSKCRIKLLSLLAGISAVKDGHSKRAPTTPLHKGYKGRSISRVFTHPDLIQKGTPYNGSRLSKSLDSTVTLPIPCG